MQRLLGKDMFGLLKEEQFCVGAAWEGKNVKLRSSLDQCLEDIVKTGLLLGGFKAITGHSVSVQGWWWDCEDTSVKAGRSVWILVVQSELMRMLLVKCEVKSLSCAQLFATPWTVARQVPLPMGFSRQEYWNELPCPPPRDLPNLGMEPVSPALQAVSLPLEPPGKPSMECC